MSQIVNQNPGSSEVQSPLIAGVAEGLNKISAILNLKTGTLEDVQLNPVPIDDQESNKNRIYEANTGNHGVGLSGASTSANHNIFFRRSMLYFILLKVKLALFTKLF